MIIVRQGAVDPALLLPVHDQVLDIFIFVQDVQVDILLSACIPFQFPSVQILPDIPVIAVVPAYRGVQAGDPFGIPVKSAFQIFFIKIRSGIYQRLYSVLIFNQLQECC